MLFLALGKTSRCSHRKGLPLLASHLRVMIVLRCQHDCWEGPHNFFMMCGADSGTIDLRENAIDVTILQSAVILDGIFL